MLILVCGLPGVGKTTVARIISDKIKGNILRTDIVRKEMIKKLSNSEEEKEMVYDEVLSRAEKLISKKENVVLDATFGKEKRRDKVNNLARKLSITLKIVEVICDEEILKKRIKSRKDDESDADFDIYLLYKNNKNRFEPIKEKHEIIDNSGTKSELSPSIDKFLSN